MRSGSTLRDRRKLNPKWHIRWFRAIHTEECRSHADQRRPGPIFCDCRGEDDSKILIGSVPDPDARSAGSPNTLTSEPRRPSQIEILARTAFHADVRDRDGICVGRRRHDHRCSGQLEGHHVIPKRWIKAHLATVEIDEATFWGFVFDTRDGVLVCRSFHDELEDKRARLAVADLPAGIGEFAGELEIPHLLERAVPELGGARG